MSLQGQHEELGALPLVQTALSAISSRRGAGTDTSLSGVRARGPALRHRAGGEAPPPSRDGGHGHGHRPGRGGGRSGRTAGTMQLLPSLSPVTWLLLVALLCLVAL